MSALCSRRLINKIHEETGVNPGFAVQKFSRLIVRGLLENNVEVSTLSVPPISRRESNRIWINIDTETEDGVEYKYIPFLNYPFLKHICLLLYTFFQVLIWGLCRKKDRYIICDVLSISSCFGALLASKINGIKSVAVVTDIYSQMVGEKTNGLKRLMKLVAGKMQQWYSSSFTHYVLLTEYMNEAVNPHRRPYIVMESLCDGNENCKKQSPKKTNENKIIMYAGGIEEKYGLRALVEGFSSITRDDISLVLYGHGSYVETLKQICLKDSRIQYKGIAPNEEIVKAEFEAALLVNPRPTTEEFTKYSFPSKNMEYMVSGTPVLTTMLPGMPKEYYSYVYLFDKGENAVGYAESLEEVLSKPTDELLFMGEKAREYVLREKNNVKQARRIIDLINI